MRTPKPFLIFGLLGVTLLTGTLGCRRGSGNEAIRTAEAPVTAGNDTSSTNVDTPVQAPIKPLPGIAEERPAPKDIPSLDMAETAQAAKPDGIQENKTLAFAYYRSRAYAQAAPAFERVTQLDPKDPTAYLYLGYSQLAAGALEQAIKTFDAVIQLPGVNRDVQSEAYLHKGYALGALDKKDKAREAFSLSLGNNTRQGLASLALGGLAAEAGQKQQAHDFFADASRDLPPGRHRARAFAALGRLAEQKGDAKAARAAYKSALAADEDDTWAQEGMKRLAAAKPAKT